tara:strand:- start:610 stop:1146 length:537 start_codon:yes stop_codon:yes gene_type:complete
MLGNLMIINKDIQKKVDQDYFFIQGRIQLDTEYFINKINQSCNSEDNLNYQTNVKGNMTPFKFFQKDQNFIRLLNIFIEYVDENVSLRSYKLSNAWGFSNKPLETTNFHDHFGSVWSGAIYLNSCNQTLDFPQINQSLKPEEGSFALFSSFLNHGCKRNKDNFEKFGLSFNMEEVKPW